MANRPWIAEGLSRTEYYRRQQKALMDVGSVEVLPPASALTPLEAALEIMRDRRAPAMARLKAVVIADQFLVNESLGSSKAARAREEAARIGRGEGTGDWGDDLQSRVVKRLVDYRQQ
jgi:hypothetical protein